MVLSNVQMSGVRDSIRMNALQSFNYFANTVLAVRMSDDLCTHVQDVVEDGEDFLIKTNLPKSLALALQAWLMSRGITVISDFTVSQHEILSWLELGCNEPCKDVAVSLTVLPEGVSITWL